jgi:hypothetical protein
LLYNLSLLPRNQPNALPCDAISHNSYKILWSLSTDDPEIYFRNHIIALRNKIHKQWNYRS